MSVKEIEMEQRMANIRYEAAKKIAELLDKAEAEYAKLGGEDWQEEMEAIRELVFEGNE